MTVPRTALGYTDYNSMWGVNSDVANQEWNQMMQRRAELVDSIMSRISIRSQLPATTPDPARVADNLQNRSIAVPQPEVDANYRDQLYGAARFYDIPNYDKLPLSTLNNIVAQRRIAMQDPDKAPNDVITQAGLGGAATLMGTLQGAIGLARRLPFIGKAIGDNSVTRALYQKTAEFQEGLTADLTPEDRYALETSNTIGQQYAPAATAWKLAGGIMSRGLGMATTETWAPTAAMGWATQAIGRAALSGIQGGLSGGMLELYNNPKDPNLLKGVGLGAGFGALSELALGAAGRIFQGRLTRSFSTPFDEPGMPQLGAGPMAEGGGITPRGLLPSGGPAPATAPGMAMSAPVQSGPLPALAGEVQAPVRGFLPSGPTPITPMGPIGSTGLIPPERGLPSPYQPPPSPTPQSNMDAGLYSHYSNMARNAAETNPELAASMMRIAEQFAPAEPVTNQYLATPFDPRSIITDYDFDQIMQARQGGVPAPTQPSLPEPTFDEQINAAINGLNGVKGGKGGGSVSVPEAVTAATNLTKRATIAESPAVLDMARQPVYDDADVARAAMASNPGGIQILQGVGNEAKTVAQLTRAQVEGKLMPHTFRSVTVNVPNDAGELIPRTDMLVSDGLPITNKRVAQYKDTGMFEGMRATLPGGSDVVVIEPAKVGGFATVRGRNSDLQLLVPAADIMPGKTTDVFPADVDIHDAPALYTRFRNQVISENEAAADEAQIPRYGWLDDPTTEILPHQIQGFLDQNDIMNPVSRAAISNYIGAMRIKDFQATSPAQIAAMRSINAQAAARTSESRMINSAPMSIDAMASSRGLRWENYPGTAGGTLRNIYTQEDYPMQNEDAAREFMKSYNYEQPDLTPETAVPLEVMETVPGDNHPGDMEDPNAYDFQHADAYDHLAAIAESEDEFTAPYGGMSPEDIELARSLSQQAYEAAAAQTGASVPGTQLVAPPGGSGSLPPAPPSPPGRPPLPTPGGAPQPGPESGRVNVLAKEFANADQGQLWKAEKRFSDIWLRKGMTMRGVFLEMQQRLEDAGVSSNALWSDYGDIVNAKATAHNVAEPFHREINDITNVLRTSVKRGTAAKILEIGDENERILAMDRAGLSQAERGAIRQARDMFDRLFEWTGLPPERYIPNYISHVRSAAGRQAQDPWGDAKDFLPSEIQFFAEYAREGGINPREMDLGTLMHTYVRAMTTERYVAGPYNSMLTKWQDPRIPAPFADLVQNWLKVVRTGYDPSWSYSIQGVRSMLNTFGVPVTDHDVSRLWSVGLSGMYRNFLSRPYAMFRDSIQPFMAGARIGHTSVVKAYTDFMKSPTARQEMIERAYANGWAEKGMVPTANADVFNNQVLPQYETQQFGTVGTAVRDAASGAFDLMRDVAPESLRSGLQGTKADPARLYGKLGEFNRIISGQAGWQKATDAIGSYRAGNISFDQMMNQSKANVWSRPIRDQFSKFVEAGRDQDAANILAHEAANTQFRYGTAEGAMDMRTHDGRLGMTFGNFTTQQIQYMREGLSNGSVADRVAFAGRYGMVQGALKLASAYTGWKFSKWAWYNAFGFTGGPVMQAAAGLYQNVKDGRVGNPADAAGNLLSTVNPYGGVLNTVEGSTQAAQGANPSENFFRFLVTGEQGSRTDIEHWLRNMQVDQSTGQRINVGGAPVTPHYIPASPPQPGGGGQY